MISTGDAAELLGVSRQHVVDLCDRELLDAVRVGRHRRIRRSAVLELLPARRRDVERLRWLHAAVAGRLVRDPDNVIAKARTNLSRLQSVHRRGGVASVLAEWGRILDRGVDAVFETLTSRSPRAAELRQNSPFAGVLPEAERRQVLDAFQAHWRADRLH